MQRRNHAAPKLCSAEACRPPLRGEAVARIGVEGFKQLVLSTGKNLTPPLWQKARALRVEVDR